MKTGHIAMGARLFDADGTLLSEVADFEYGTPSLTGDLLLDTKDFRPYAYQRQTIDHWADEFATLATTPYEKKIHRPSPPSDDPPATTPAPPLPRSGSSVFPHMESINTAAYIRPVCIAIAS